MGLYGRDWMRDDRGGGGGLLVRHRVTWWLIGINAGLWFVFAGSLGWGGRDTGLFAFIADHLLLHTDEVLAKGKIWQLATAFFFHDPSGLGHVFFNMLFLFFFGRVVEDMIGPGRYLRLYLAAGFASTIALTVLGLLGAGPIVALGASGSVYGVGVFLAFRRPRMQVIFFVIQMPLWVLVGVFMVGSELLNLAVLRRGVGTAVGHLAGAAWGWHVHRRGGGWEPSALGRWWARRRARREQVTRRQAQAQDEAVEARVDELLARIQTEGIGALSDEEKDFLEQASRRFRRP